MKAKNSVPVLLMLFNRPEHTRKVFEKVREVKPSRLFVAANGPRADVPEDVRLCKEVQAIFNEVDWECELHTNFRDVNIGMNPQWHKAMDWFFETVDRGIILEDDCVPDLSFFGYCEELLEKYKDDEIVMHVNGSNFQFGNKRGDASFYFSKYPYVWGWATWKRAWNKYDNTLGTFPVFKRENMIDTALSTEVEKKYWMKYFSGLYSGIYIDSATKWLYAIWSNGGYCITPNVNMITNIGHGVSAGNTFFKNKMMDQETHDIGAIRYPASASVDTAAEYFTFNAVYRTNFFKKAFYVIVKKIVKLSQ